MLHTIELSGRGGRNLRDAWGEDDPRAYLGMTVPDFPSFFAMYGPDTNLGHGGSLILQGECQARYIAQAVRQMAEKLDVDRTVFERYNAEVDAQLASLVWGRTMSPTGSRTAKGGS